MKTAFVTGATGQLGSNLVLLLLEQGWQVKALARSAEKARKMLGNTAAEIVIGDLDKISAFATALSGVDVVFHTAAYFREYFTVGDHWATLKKLNVDATIELMNSSEQHGVKKFIHTSSSGVIGNAPKSGSNIGDETTAPGANAETNLYFKSKVLCEQAINDWRKTHKMPVVMILPTVMIGTHDAGPTAIGQAIISVARAAFPAVPPGGFEFVDSRDVAQGMINAVEKGKDGERYIISEGYHTMQEMAQTASQAAGVKPPALSMPYFMAITVATLSEWSARLTGAEPMITRSAVHAMTDQHRVSSAKARRELGITTRPFTQSIADEVAWYKTNGFVG